MTNRAKISGSCGFTIALAASVAGFSAPAAADSCTKLSSLVLPEVISITATSIAADSFTPPGPPGLAAPVPVAFCRVQITVKPAIKSRSGCRRRPTGTTDSKRKAVAAMPA